MISTNNLSLRFGKRILFEDVNLKFVEGNCYGIIGANGSGKSTFLKILSGEITPTTGSVDITKGQRMAVLKQNHFEFNEFQVLETVIMGHKPLYDIMKEKDALYAKPDFNDEDGMRAGELEALFAEMDGWNAESDAATLLSNLGVPVENHDRRMEELDGNQKVRVLLAQAIFGNPDILLLDEPTNEIDLEATMWLEDFLADYPNVVLVVSHDRHFLDSVCTHVVDIDYGKMTPYTGNYTFWYESSQLASKLRTEQNKRAEEKVKELQEFIRRFSANASKSKQATSRKKLLDKIKVEDIRPSSRKYPAILLNNMVRELGDRVLKTEHLGAIQNGEVLFNEVTIEVQKGDKIALLSRNSLATTAFYEILTGRNTDFTGEFQFGVTVTTSYVPIDNAPYFEGVNLSLVDWLRQYSEDKDETFVRGFLGRMLFSGDEALKQAKVLSGGEKMRCMFSRMQLQRGNVLLFDEPTNHLDLESITSLNNALQEFPSTILLTSKDHTLVQTVANRIIELTPSGVIDKWMPFDEYIADPAIKALRDEMYATATV
ncbi:MAG: ATP-binding cassette domain-containing protein [Bacteroidetes Order II. Incertae sedis bacterium]|nr:ATP-binding cassette domain-containing protein [Bacteroidetes Order II. bacterium]